MNLNVFRFTACVVDAWVPGIPFLSIGSRILFSVDEHVRNWSKVQIEVPKIDAIDWASAGGEIYVVG